MAGAMGYEDSRSRAHAPPYSSLPSGGGGNMDASIISTRQGLVRFNQGQSSQGPQQGLVNSVARFMEEMVV